MSIEAVCSCPSPSTCPLCNDRCLVLQTVCRNNDVISGTITSSRSILCVPAPSSACCCTPICYPLSSPFSLLLSIRLSLSPPFWFALSESLLYANAGHSVPTIRNDHCDIVLLFLRPLLLLAFATAPFVDISIANLSPRLSVIAVFVPYSK